jgi:hypothetical protein
MLRAATLIVFLALCSSAAAIVRVPEALGPVPGNPADKLAGQPIEDFVYDDATHCSRKRRPGVEAFTDWLERGSRGVSWGSYRCEMWGEKEASLHAEGRALDWHLDRAVAADRREAERLILLLLAPDSAGEEQALARRMGVQEIIWDCGYWRTGMRAFSKYAPCVNKHGRARRTVDPTVAHRNHVHFGFSKAGAARRTSFWAQ